MGMQSTAKRVRRQFANRFRHLAKLGRPVYARRSVAAQAKRLAAIVARERAIQQRKGMKKG